MLMTAEQAHETMLDCINYYNEPEVYIEKQIAESDVIAAWNQRTGGIE